MTIYIHKNDIPADLNFGPVVAIDTETLGLNPARDRLCVAQLSSGDGDAHLVQFDGINYEAPNLRVLLADPSVEKIFHFARFDVAVLKAYLQVDTAPLFCTKIGSKLCRTYTDRHGLKDVVREFTGVELDKQQQSSDWAAPDLSEKQQAYAASDVLYLHEVREKMIERLKRDGRFELAQSVFNAVTVRAELDLLGWADQDIFSH